VTGIAWGVWDLLHVGHLALLRNASEQCDRLLVGVTTDKAALVRKGRAPVIPYAQRREMLLHLPYVAAAFRQDASFTKRDAVNAFEPDAIFVGDDWTPESFDGEGLGVPVIYVPRVPMWSSTWVRSAARQ
jgi:glycerol-3-phosphate cytidylyltransferase